MSQSVASALDNRVVNFVGSVDSIFSCVICLQVADNPARCSALCTGVFCYDCLCKALIRSRYCPICSIETSNIPLRDVVLRSQIMNNEVVCFNNGTEISTTRTRKRKAAQEERCTWTGKYDQLVAHLNQCDFEMVKCTIDGCAAKVERFKLLEHLQVCAHRMANCGHCNIVVKAAAMLNHLRQCPKVDASCECGFECTRDALPAHRDKDCPLVEIGCDVIGCDAKMMRGDYEKHCDESSSDHIRLLSKGLKLAIQENSVLKRENERLGVEVRSIKQDTERLKQRFPLKLTWRLVDFTAALQMAATDEKGVASPRFDIGSHKIYMRAVIQGNRFGLYLHKDSNLSDDKSHLEVGGTVFIVTKPGLPDKKVTLSGGACLQPPEWKGVGLRSLLTDIRPYIDNDSINIIIDLRLGN